MNVKIMFLEIYLLISFSMLFGQTSTGDAVMFLTDISHSNLYKGNSLRSLTNIAWSFKTNGPIRSSAAVAGSNVFFGSGDGYFYSLDKNTGEEKWRFKTGNSIQSSPCIVGNSIYFISRDNFLYEVEKGTGEEIWKLKLGEDIPYRWGFDYFLSSPVFDKGCLYFGSGDGNLYSLNLKDKVILWKYDTGRRIRTTPAISEGKIIFGDTEGTVYAVGRNTGRVIWTFSVEGIKYNLDEFGYDRKAIISSPVISSGTVLFGCRDGNLYAVDLVTGAEKWRVSHETSWIITSPVVYDNTVFAGSSDAHFMQAIDLNTGKEKWRFNVQQPVWSTAALTKDVVYFGEFGGALHAVDMNTGKELWEFKTDNILGSPVISENTIYFGSDNGLFYALTGSTEETKRDTIAKAVFYEKIEKNFWFRNGVDEWIKNYFQMNGYEVLDKKSLSAFVSERIKDNIKSVIVFASVYMPPEMLDDNNSPCLFRKYLDYGGKVILTGADPLAYKYDSLTLRAAEIDYLLPGKVHDVHYSGSVTDAIGGWYGTTLTEDGRKWGLENWWLNIISVDKSEVSTVLAYDEFGKAAAWVKNYGWPEGRGLVRVWVNRDAPGNLDYLKRIAEYGF